MAPLHDTPIYPLVMDVETALHNARVHFKTMEHVYVEWIAADAKTISADLHYIFRFGDAQLLNDMYDRYREQLPDAMSTVANHLFRSLGISTDDEFEELIRVAFA